MQTPSLPFKVLALAPFRLTEKTSWDTDPVRIDKTTLDQAIENMGIALDISVPGNLCKTGYVTITIRRMKDFHPDRIIENTPFLNNLLSARKFVQEAKAGGSPDETIYRRLREWPDLPIEIRYEQKKEKTDTASPIDDILKMVSLPDEVSAPSSDFQSLTFQIDSLLQQILNCIFADADFRKLESVWQGLRLLLQQTDSDHEVSFEIIPASPGTLEETLDHLMSDLIEDPPSLIILDHAFDNSSRSLELLNKIAFLSETLLVPFICWISPAFLYLESWKDLEKLPFLPHYLDDPAFAKWRHLRKTPQAGWVAMTCNRFLIRYPYGADNKPTLISFSESHDLWISPVWALASLICRSLSQTGWPARFTSWQTVHLENLALSLTSENKYLSTEVFLNNERAEQFLRIGIIPIIAPYNKDTAFVPHETSVAGSSFRYQLFVSMVTRFLFWCRDNFGKDLDPVQIERNLKQAFLLFWQKTGHKGPQSLDISASRQAPDQPIRIKFIVEPSQEILPTGERIELEFNW